MDIKQLIKDVESFAAKIGRTPEYVCRKATNHPKLLARLYARLAQSERDAEKLRSFMDEYVSPDADNTTDADSKQQTSGCKS